VTRLSLRQSITVWALIPMAIFSLIMLTFSIAWTWRNVVTVVNERNEKLAQVSAIALRGHAKQPPPNAGEICQSLDHQSKQIRGTLYIVSGNGQIVCASSGARLTIGMTLENDLRSLIAPDRAASLSSTLGDSPYIASAAPIADTPWTVLLEESRANVFAPTYSFLIAMSTLMFALLVFAFLILWFGIQRIVEPLSAVTAQAERVAAGHTFIPPDVSGPVDVEALVTAFNHMVTRLRRQRDTLHDYATRTLHSQEEERKRISRDLHDETAQDLVGLMQRIDLCRLQAGENPQLIPALDELADLTSNTLLGVRRMSHALRPLILEDLGLVAALQTITEDLGRQLTDARISCQVIGDERRLPPETELTAFRIVQEALTNVRKHARYASWVYVTVQFQPDLLQVSVEDDGPGFRLTQSDVRSNSDHLGLLGMKERAELLGGMLDIHSQPRQGTRVTLTLPLT